MLFTDYQGESLSLLGFGTMRLPTLENGAIDEKQVGEMVDYAMEHGVSYFDTAYPYHGGMSEIAIGRALKKYPRERWHLADKYPGHQIASSYDPAAVFEEQLRKCGVEYFDFYLLHNVYENSIHTYLDRKWGIIDYFREQKRLGRIRHLGFSCHGQIDCLREFLDAVGDSMEFCQIQLNWLDWTLQDARAKVALLNERKIPIWVMEPVRGGRLCQLSAEDERALRALRPDEGIPAFGYRFVQEVPGVQMILSGMSNLAQMEENVRTFENRRPLTEGEYAALMNIAEGMKNSVPCTGCRYCTDHCPMGLNIPQLLSGYNELRFAAALNVSMRLEGLPEYKQPSACIGCGSCAALCPQGIDIPKHLAELSEKLRSMPKWADLCRQREEAAKKAAR